MSNSYNKVIDSGRKEGFLFGVAVMGAVWLLCANFI